LANFFAAAYCSIELIRKMIPSGIIMNIPIIDLNVNPAISSTIPIRRYISAVIPYTDANLFMTVRLDRFDRSI
jgi:hypothetical protein